MMLATCLYSFGLEMFLFLIKCFILLFLLCEEWFELDLFGVGWGVVYPFGDGTSGGVERIVAASMYPARRGSIVNKCQPVGFIGLSENETAETVADSTIVGGFRYVDRTKSRFSVSEVCFECSPGFLFGNHLAGYVLGDYKFMNMNGLNI